MQNANWSLNEKIATLKDVDGIVKINGKKKKRKVPYVKYISFVYVDHVHWFGMDKGTWTRRENGFLLCYYSCTL